MTSHHARRLKECRTDAWSSTECPRGQNKAKWRSSWLKRRNAWSSTIGAKNRLRTVPQTQSQNPNHRKLQSLLILCVFIIWDETAWQITTDFWLLHKYEVQFQTQGCFSSLSTTMAWYLWNAIWSHVSDCACHLVLKCSRGSQIKTLHSRSWEQLLETAMKCLRKEVATVHPQAFLILSRSEPRQCIHLHICC